METKEKHRICAVLGCPKVTTTLSTPQEIMERLTVSRVLGYPKVQKPYTTIGKLRKSYGFRGFWGAQDYIL